MAREKKRIKIVRKTLAGKRCACRFRGRATRRDSGAEASMTSAEGDINEMVFGMTVAVLMHYAEMRVGEGVSNKELKCRVQAVRTRDQ